MLETKASGKSLFLVGETATMREKGMCGVSPEVVSLLAVFPWVWQLHGLPSHS